MAVVAGPTVSQRRPAAPRPPPGNAQHIAAPSAPSTRPPASQWPACRTASNSLMAAQCTASPMKAATPSTSAATTPTPSNSTGKRRPAMSDAASSKLDTNASVMTVPVRAQYRLIYEFDTKATRADLAIPYLVIVNGKVQEPDKPRRLSRENRKIIVTVDARSKVALYLNSDVRPNHRRNPVYEVIVNDKNVVVKITEKTGNKDLDPPTVKPASPTPSTSSNTDFYTAKLTGDIWMTISHRYTEAEADALLPAHTDPVVRKAVCSIYRGLGI
ncbi:conserved hypothetical protein, partial [Ricinus communis]